ncbi:MAG: diguanylate cyclase [Magnetococcales bacterium]|nr:diguanylate cyclase [Magnetococcales bacterium]
MSTSHPLDKVLLFLEGRHEDRQGSIRILKDHIFKDLLGQDSGDLLPCKVLQSLAEGCIKPLLRGEQEKQAVVDDLLENVRSRPSSAHIGEFLEVLAKLQNWIGEAMEGQLASSQARLAAQKLILLIRSQWPLPTETANQVERFLQIHDTLPSHDFWKELNQLCQIFQSLGKELRQAWDEERKTFFRLVGELATQMEEMRQNTGGMGRRLSDSIHRMQESQSLEDLQQLRIMLVREAEDLKVTTQQLNVKLTETKTHLESTKNRLEEMEAELRRARTESLTDPLTGVLNRRAFDKYLEREYARVKRHQSPLSVVLFDLDHFKRINDTYGHPVGDKVLINVAEKATQSLRQADVIARYGGEEFILLLPDTNQEEAVRAAERIRESILKMRFRVRGELVTITSSFGVSTWRGEMTPAILVESADQALYRAKQEGRNRVVVAD